MGAGSSTHDWTPELKKLCSEHEDPNDKIAPREYQPKSLRPLKSQLGTGRMGKLRLCKLSVGNDESTSTTVVCKHVRPAFSEAARLGAAQMAQLSEMAPATVLKFMGAITKGKIVLLFEYCELGSLDSFLTQRIGISTADKLSMLAQVADGMSELEALGFVHGSLCCRNILVAAGGTAVKVSDWGVRSTSDRELAPELLAVDDSKNRIFTHATDAWSFGLVSHEVLNDAKPAFAVEWDDFQVKQKVLRGFRPKQPEGCPNEIQDIITKCLSENPPSRPEFFWLRGELEDHRDAATENERAAAVDR